jgi:hypothetical protein
MCEFRSMGVLAIGRRSEKFCLLSVSTCIFDPDRTTSAVRTTQPNLHWRRVMRVEQSSGTKGSLKWIQRLVSDHADLLEKSLRSVGALGTDAVVDWVSPCQADGWAEYRDAAFLDQLQLGRLRDDLRVYWPSMGPQWDALGRTSDGGVILVEAKAHVGELVSRCEAVSPESLAKIEAAFDSTRRALGAGKSGEWMTRYYQYANRLAHLHFLRDHGVDAQLALVCLCGDSDMPGPNGREDFEHAVGEVRRSLGVPEGQSSSHVFDVFIDVALLH